MAMVTGAYVLITFWQYRNACVTQPGLGCYNVRDPLDLALIAAATAGACIGFLWWNAAPARIFMGDVGALGIGSALALLALTTDTQLLLVLICGIIVHIYAALWIKGSIGAMVRGTVTFGWARKHHPKWFRESIK